MKERVERHRFPVEGLSAQGYDQCENSEHDKNDSDERLEHVITQKSFEFAVEKFVQKSEIDTSEKHEHYHHAFYIHRVMPQGHAVAVR